MNIKEVLRYATDVLKSADIEAPALEAGVMLCHVLKCDRTYLFCHDDRELDSSEYNELKSMLERRVHNEPLQYIIGKTEFMSLPFIVNPAVLIPRQDTEILVEKCIELVQELGKSGQKSIRVLDMCTGSGCIAISIARYCPDCSVLACDVSQNALDTAKANSELNETQGRLELRCSDLFERLDGEQFDIIVSNPPYIETEVVSELQSEVREHEPMLALDGGTDGLDFYRKIIDEAPKHLSDEGYLAFEIGYNQGQSVKKLMQERFYDISIIKDLGGNDRVVAGRINRSKV